MKAKYYLIVALMLGLVGGVATTGLGVGRDFGLPSAHAGDVPAFPAPECVDCGPGYHCNAAKNGCEPDAPAPDPKPKEKPINVPAPDE